MKLFPFYGHGWESNCYLLIDGKDAVLVDAGIDHALITDLLAREGATLSAVILTHGHFDHTVSVDKLRDATGAQVMIHTDDAEMLTDAEKSALYYFFGTRDAYRPADRLIKDGDEIPLGGETLRVLHTPGHSRGSICLLSGDTLLTGDTLFDGGFGRYDLYGGDRDTLARSLATLGTLDSSLTIYPGHGGPAPLGAALNAIRGAI